jgi:hypothetical protein
MMLRRTLLLQTYLIQAAQQKFAWGQWDCNLFLSKWVDQFFTVRSSNEIQGKYSTALGAARFYKNYLTVPQYLQAWQHKPATGPMQTGDILLEHEKLWIVPYIVCNNHAYTVHHEHNLIELQLADVEHLEIWRI